MSNSDAKNPEVDFSKFQLLHQLFRHRAADPIQTNLLAFPKSGFADYEYFSGKALDRFTDTAAWHYAGMNLRMVCQISQRSLALRECQYLQQKQNTDSCHQHKDWKRVALLGSTNLDWVVSFFALSRAGYTILTLSPRLSASAIVKLMQETHCECLIYYDLPQLLAVLHEAVSLMSLQTLPMLSHHDYDRPNDSVLPFERDVDVAEERRRPATILHSSGSTGLPKPIQVAHARYTISYAIGPGDRDFVTLPL